MAAPFRDDLERERAQRRLRLDDWQPTHVLIDTPTRDNWCGEASPSLPSAVCDLRQGHDGVHHYHVHADDPDRPIDGEARPPADWEQANSADRNLAYENRQDAEHRARLTRRRAMDPWERLREILALIGTFQSPGAVQHTHARARGAETTRIGPAGGDHTDLAYASRAEVERHLVAITRHTEMLEQLADNHQGIGLPSDPTLWTKQQKDRFILEECVGLRPEEVTELHPLLGKPPTIRKLRSESGRRTVDGRPKPAKAAAA